MRNGLLIVVVVLGVLAGFAVVLQFTLPDGDEARNIAAIVQASVTALAIAVAGVFAGYKLRLFRDFEPHLTISHSIAHRRVGDAYVHIFVTATLWNSSKVAVEVRDELLRVQQIAPVSREEVESLVAQVFQQKAEKYMQWPTLDQVLRAWEAHEVVVEPGESHQETVEFVIPDYVGSVLIYTYFYNPTFRQGSGTAEGWGATSAYDILV